MIPTVLLLVIIFVIFFTLYLIHTQEFYNKRSFRIPLVISVILPITIYLTAYKDDRLKLIFFSLIVLYYTILLFAISKIYKKINTAFIKNGWINKKFENKEFTQVHWDGDIASEWPDEKASPNYSWMDNLLSFLLLILPLLLSGIMTVI